MAIKNLDLLENFLEENSVLIADKNPSGRKRLIKVLMDLGAKRSNISSVATYSESEQIIKDKKPGLVLADYDLDGGHSFDLFRAYREMEPKSNAVLILVTSNISQATVSLAAEEDVDSYIIKPYTVNSLTESLVKSVCAKIHPTAYMKKIGGGKESIEAQNLNGAQAQFNEALELSKTPSLALFYNGQVNYMNKDISGAEKNYLNGLEINKIHFKCQVGLYNLFMEDSQTTKAYNVVRNIMKYYPSNPKRLKEVLKLAIQTENYSDIESYYENFKLLEVRDDEVTNYMCSALFVLGKFYFQSGSPVKAKSVMTNLVASCQQNIKFLKAVVVEYSTRELFEEAVEVFNRSEYEDREKPDYKIAQYLASYSGYDLTKRVSEGLSLFNNGVKDPYAAQFMLNALQDSESFDKYNKMKEDVFFEWPEFFGRSSQKAA